MHLKPFTVKATGFVKHIFFFPFFGEKKIWHNLFEISIFIKGLNGFWEIVAGGLFLFFSKYFLAVYFLFYGIVNIFLMVFLLRNKLWAYPTAIIFFTAFTSYLCYRFYQYRSWPLLFFIVFDIIFVVLTYLEYRRVKKSNAVW